MSSSASSRESSPVGRPSAAGKARRMKEPQTPQEKINEFWGKFQTKAPGKATSIIPQNEHAERAASRAAAKSAAPATTTEQSYEAAAERCRRKVAQIVVECRRVNQRYRDPHFDLEIDLMQNQRDCLDSLDNKAYDDFPDHFRGHAGRHGRSSRRRQLPQKDRETDDSEVVGRGSGGGSSVLGLLSMVERRERAAVVPDGDGESRLCPRAVKRVVDIFDAPQFYIDGPTAHDVRQGRDGDCWLMAALCTLSNKPGLIERCCVAHDQAVGVYGFVFHRDGEWFSEIIDDKLYLTKPDYDESIDERILWEDRERVNSEESYRKAYQTNSGALYFAQCVDPCETWLPLLEKAYAKAHGDYSAIEGGYGGEGIEDLTGGVTSEIYTTDILDKEHFWNEELMKVNEDFLFGCSTGVWGRGQWGDRKGIVELHAYSVLKAVEIDGVRLVLLKNPWGKHEWRGPWSDGSKEWTAEWLQKLDHKFGDDGSFWISYPDLLRTYQAFDRTRLFSPDWKVASIWTTLDIGWTLDYHDTKFAFTLSHSGPVVIVFSQLDERYFKGLEGQYRFQLSFRVHNAASGDGRGSIKDSYVVRSQSYYRMNRSVNVELDLDAGEYIVVVKVDAQRIEARMPVEQFVRTYAKWRREKLLRIGQAYDVAHAKGKIVETEEEKKAREAFQKRRRERERKRVAKYIKARKLSRKKAELREKTKKREEKARAKAKAEKKAAKRATRSKAAGYKGTEGGKTSEDNNSSMSESTAETAPAPTADADTTANPSTENKTEVAQPDGAETKEEETYVTAAEDNDDKEITLKKEETNAGGHKVEKQVKIEAPSITNTSPQAEGSIPGTEPAEGQHTPISSIRSIKTPTNGEVDEPEEDEAYVTAAEDDVEKGFDTASGEPSTSKPSAKPSTPLHAHFANACAETDTASPKPLQRRGTPYPLPQKPGPQERHPPAPGHHHGRGLPSPRDIEHIPPHLRGAFLAEMHMYARCHPPPPPPPASHTEEEPGSASDVSSDVFSESDLDDGVSEVSEGHIDEILAEDLRARRAAAAQAAKAARDRRGSSATDNDLDEFEKDPWNAVGVFGLRVYYKMPAAGEGEQGQEAGVTLRVERPNPHVWDESSDEDDDGDGGEQADEDKDKGKKEESQVLDVDDSAKDAVGETPPTPGVELSKQLKGETEAGNLDGKEEYGGPEVKEGKPIHDGETEIRSETK